MDISKIRICFFLGTLNLGGIGKLTLNLTEEFLSRGIEVDLFLLKKEGDYSDQIPKGARVFVADGNNILRVYKFIKYLKKEKPSVSISTRQRLSIGNIVACLFAKTEPIVSVHTNITVENEKLGKRRKATDLITNVLYKLPDKFIAVSNGVAKDLNFRTGVDVDKIRVIYNPVYIEKKDYEITLNEEVENLIYNDKQFIISAARFTEQKDLFTLIRAFHLVRNRRDLYLVILGDGPLRNEIEDLIDEFDLNDYVILTGFVNNPESYIERACLFVMSSKWEGFGNVLVEAMGVGTPVLSTDCPSGPSEILEDGKFGYLVEVENPQLMANGIINTIDNPISSSKLIERAKDFSVSKIADEYLDFVLNKN